MAVRVVIRRRVTRDKQGKVFPLIKQLRGLATVQPGYVYGETLIDADDLEESLVISTWDTLDDWEAWFSSKQRSAINNEIEVLLGDKTEYKTYFYGDAYLYQAGE